MRWYGPSIALVYDWLYSAPGVDSALLAQTRSCLTAWNDYYTASGYLNYQPGSNYNAGYVAAQGAERGRHRQRRRRRRAPVDRGCRRRVPEDCSSARGSRARRGRSGTPAGVMVGGDWAEGWQYGAIAVLNYAAATVALEQGGAPQPEMDAWANSLAVRTAYATVPDQRRPVGGRRLRFGRGLRAAQEERDLRGAGRPLQRSGGGLGGVQPQDADADRRRVHLRRPGRHAQRDAAGFPRAEPAPLALVPGPRDPRHVRAHRLGRERILGRLQLVAARTCRITITCRPRTSCSRAAPITSSSTRRRTAWPARRTPTRSPLIRRRSPATTRTSQTFWSNADLPWARGSQSGVFAARSDFAHGVRRQGHAQRHPVRASRVGDVPGGRGRHHRPRADRRRVAGHVPELSRQHQGDAEALRQHRHGNGRQVEGRHPRRQPVGRHAGDHAAAHGRLLGAAWGKCISVRFAVDDYTREGARARTRSPSTSSTGWPARTRPRPSAR